MLVSNIPLQLRTLSLKSSTGNGNYVAHKAFASPVRAHTFDSTAPSHWWAEKAHWQKAKASSNRAELTKSTYWHPPWICLTTPMPLTQSTGAASPCGLQCISIPSPACWGWQCNGTLSCLSCPLLGTEQGHKLPLEAVVLATPQPVSRWWQGIPGTLAEKPVLFKAPEEKWSQT